MSVYQYIAFRAVDRPVSEKNLEFMRLQSARAEITPWSFDNEYQYGDFRGKAVQMLRRGYDFHLHYASFGTRKLLIRLPQGLPNPKSFTDYFSKNSLTVLKDPQGPGGSLLLSPSFEAGELKDLWDLPELVERLVPLRDELLNGDLRPLYLANLATALDGDLDPEENSERPVPAGLDHLSDAQKALAEFYGLSDYLIAAAASKSPPLPAQGDPAAHYGKWLGEQSEQAKNAWLTTVMENPDATLRAELLAKYRADRGTPAWPTARPERTVAQLQAAAQEIHEREVKREQAKAERARAKRLTRIAADPAPILQETETLVTQRSRDAYERIGELLADLREALKGSDRMDLAERQAQKLKSAHPKLGMLVAELRRHGFIPK